MSGQSLAAGCVASNPTDRENGRRRSLLVDGRGVPLRIIAREAGVKVLVSFEKTEGGYVAPLALAAAMIGWRQTIPITNKG